MKKNTRNLFVVIGLFLFCLTLSLVLIFAGRGAIEDTPIRKKNYENSSVNAVSILDVNGVMRITAFNYLPNEFAELDEIISDTDEGTAPAKRGTYRFYIDTLTIEEWSNSESLSHLLKPDGNWHLTMYIPPVFAACSVFVQYQNKEYVGSIDRYNIDYYTNYSSTSEFDDTVSHQTATKPMLIDIPISSNNKYSRECIVTIHYEATNDNFVGFSGDILIGEDSAIQSAVTQNRLILLFDAIIGAATLLLFLLICILKRSFSFIPQLLFAAGIFFSTVFHLLVIWSYQRSVFVARDPPIFRRIYPLCLCTVSSEENRKNPCFIFDKRSRNCRNCIGIPVTFLHKHIRLYCNMPFLCRFKEIDDERQRIGKKGKGNSASERDRHFQPVHKRLCGARSGVLFRRLRRLLDRPGAGTARQDERDREKISVPRLCGYA